MKRTLGGPRAPQRLPTCYDEWEESARKLLDPVVFSYIYSGAGGGLTSRANSDAFYNLRLVPRVLRDVSSRDLSVTLFGRTHPSPIVLAPMGSQKRIHPDGELASARAAASTGTPLILSTVASATIEEVADEMREGTRWFQLYPSTDRDVNGSLIHRAKDSGYSAIVITVDRAGEYPRYGVLPGRKEAVGPIYLSDPVFREKARNVKGRDAEELLLRRIRRSSSFTWKDVRWARDETSLPVILKGVLHPKDAEMALDDGVDGIIVSNHGGRRMDGEVAALDALPAIVSAVSGRIPVMLDSGIRGGVDVIKAMAVGADAVLIGHLYAYGLAVAGERGVHQVITNLISEVDSALAICGYRSVKDLDGSILSRR